jgi:thiol-disulfide isomerase/thioredoxin
LSLKNKNLKRLKFLNPIKDLKKILNGNVLFFFLLPLLSAPFYLSAQDMSLLVHIRGVYESRISLLTITDNGMFKPLREANGIKDGSITSLEIEREYLPGEFVLRFDYKEKQTSTSYPCEKRIFIGSQDIELWVNPKYCNNPDSTYFQPGEAENSTYAAFAGESYKRKEQLGLLQQLLMNYDDSGSWFYKKAAREYEKRRREYNEWIAGKENEDSALFVSRLYMFEFVPATRWSGTERERLISTMDHYFDGTDLSDPALTRASHITGWIDTYVNLYGQMATSTALRDSLFPAAARKAIEKAKEGSPEVYGWMVDYFYRGFEINNIPAGMKALEPYLNDPTCLTLKKKEIERRLKGMEALVAGTKAPDIKLKNPDGSQFDLYSYNPSARYLLLLFWSAECSHCREIIDILYPWQQQPGIADKLSVVAISLDETETEIAAWRKALLKTENWTHFRADEGARSKVAGDYYIMSTPQMFLLDAATKEITGLPGTDAEIKTMIEPE